MSVHVSHRVAVAVSAAAVVGILGAVGGGFTLAGARAESANQSSDAATVRVAEFGSNAVASDVHSTLPSPSDEWTWADNLSIIPSAITCATCWSVEAGASRLRGKAYDIVQLPLANKEASDQQRANSVLMAADARAKADPQRPVVVVVYSNLGGFQAYSGEDPQRAITSDIQGLKEQGITHALIAMTTKVAPEALYGATPSLPGSDFSIIGVGADGRLESSVSGLKATLAALN